MQNSFITCLLEFLKNKISWKDPFSFPIVKYFLAYKNENLLIGEEFLTF